MSKASELIISKKKAYTEGYVGSKGPAAVPNKVYLNITIEALWIPFVRKGLTKFYGAMQGSFMLPHRTGKKQEYQVFLPTADGKELDSLII